MAREALAVVLAVAIAVSTALGGVLVVALAPPLSEPLSICSGHERPATPRSELTPQDPTLLTQCGQYALTSGNIVFSLSESVDLRGAWVASAPISLAVFNATTGGASSGWPCPGCYGESGSLNITLFPGTYLLAFAFEANGPRPVTLTATQAFVAQFGRSTQGLAAPAEIPLAPEAYAAWTVPLPANATGIFLELSLATTSCSFAVAFLPSAVFTAFQTNRSAIVAPGALLVEESYASSCPPPPLPLPAVSSNAPPFLSGVLGPLHLSTNDTLVFLNTAPGLAELWVLAPIEVSYWG